MNHDYAHCADFKDDCPKKCFRAQLVRDLQKYGKLAPYGINFPISWIHFKGTDECKKEKGNGIMILILGFMTPFALAVIMVVICALGG